MNRQIGDGRDREVLVGEIVGQDRFGDEESMLPYGTPVHVYRTSNSSPHWFYDPATDRCATEFSLDLYVVGTVREVSPANIYRVTVLRGGRELYLDWMARSWVRLPGEPPPDYCFDAPRPR